MSALRSIPCHTDDELFALLDGANTSLREYAPYNGTPEGARAIADCLKYRATVRRELERRGLMIP